MATGRNILIIDDDTAVASAYKEQLEREGYTVELVRDGPTGYYRIQESAPDAVLLDLMLPEMNGVEILKKIRAQKRFQKLPVIAFSNAFMINLINEAVEAGATKVFNKAAVSPRDIVSTLQTAVFPSLPAEFILSDDQKLALTQAPSAMAASSAASKSDRFASLPSLRMREEVSDKTRRKPGSTAPAPPVRSSTAQIDPEQLQAELRNKLARTAREVLGRVRKSLNEWNSDREGTGTQALSEMSQAVHSLTGKAAIAGAENLAHFSSAVSALLKELSQKPHNINVSSKRTLVRALDAMANAIEQPERSAPWTSPTVLVVDDDRICRDTLRAALNLAELPAISVGEPDLAVKLLEENSFALIFLDVGMPGTNGFELCEKIRALPEHKSTPVIFVTALDDVENRTRASASGASDFISKPYLLVEMAVKALTYLSATPGDPAIQTAKAA